MISHARQKVCVLIDNNSLSSCFHGGRVNFGQLLEILVGGREAVVQRFYCGEAGTETNREQFYRYLRSLGFDVVISRIWKRTRRSAQFDPEITSAILCDMAWDMCSLVERGYYDAFVIVTGSIELLSAISKVRERGINVEVAFFEDRVPPALRTKATSFKPLEKDRLKCNGSPTPREKVHL